MGHASRSLPTPSLAHRDKKINLNYPLPVSNDPNEPIRQKWISDAYQLLKSVLPPKAVDTPEELAALSQFLVNVIDFRDPDCTMTHFRNPDVKVVLGIDRRSGLQPDLPGPDRRSHSSGAARRSPWTSTAWSTTRSRSTRPWRTRSRARRPTQTNRFFVELVNTLSQTAIGLLPANDFGPGITNPPDVSTLDLSLANYDMVMTADDPVSRPDPFTGQLLPIAYRQLLRPDSVQPGDTRLTNPLFATPGDVQLTPLYSVGAPAATRRQCGRFSRQRLLLRDRQYRYRRASRDPPPRPAVRSRTAYDPFTGDLGPVHAVPANVVPPGYCPNLAPSRLLRRRQCRPRQAEHDAAEHSADRVPKQMNYYWICLRRPANPFAPPQPDISLVDANGHSTYNPMVVVDAMRFPYIEGGGTAGPPATVGTNAIYSSQRCQPFRGGHAVRLPSDTSHSRGTALHPLRL